MTLAGCVDGTVLTDAPANTQETDTQDSPESEMNDETPSDDRTATEVTVEITIENEDEEPRSGTVEVIHEQTPACRYSTPPCGTPSTRNVALNDSFTLADGEHQTIQPVEMRVEPSSDPVDAYSLHVTTNASTGILNGLEAGATQVVGRDNVDEFPWRVVGRTYRVTATITPEDVDIALKARD